MSDRPRRAVGIRPARQADAAAIAEIHNQSIQAGGATMEDELKTTGDVERQLAAFGPREGLLVAESAGVDEVQEVIGWGLIKKYSPRAGYRYTCETAVYVDRGALGRGIGSALKRALIVRCKALGYHHMVAKIFASNIASIEYNKRLGYETVGRQREIGYKNGEWCDVVIMQLILADVEPDPAITG
ncbi:MAG: N-acetyltransferase family protein [Acidobacteriota bacterium]